MPFGIGLPEILIFLVVVLLLFGAKRVPEIGRSVGKGMREFKDAVTGTEKDERERGQISEPESGASGTSTTEDRATKPESERVSSP